MIFFGKCRPLCLIRHAAAGGLTGRGESRGQGARRDHRLRGRLHHRAGRRTCRRTPEPGWLIDSDSARSPIERYLADSFRFHHVMDVQSTILAQTDASLLWALSRYLDDLDRGDVPARAARGDPRRVRGRRAVACSSPMRSPCRCRDCHEPRVNRKTDPRQSGGVPVALAAIPVPPRARDADLPRHPAGAGQGPRQYRPRRSTYLARDPPARHFAAPALPDQRRGRNAQHPAHIRT